MESGNKTSDSDSDENQNIPRFAKLSFNPSIGIDKENERKKLAKLLKRYKGSKVELIRNTKDLHKISSILRRDKRQTICFEEYSKLAEQKNICKIYNKGNYINMPLPQENNTMKKLSKYSVEELKELQIFINSKCENEHENIEDFLLSFGSTQIKVIRFHGYSIGIQDENFNSYYEVFPCSGYFNCLRDVISKATIVIWIDKILFSSKEFSAIFRAAKHAKDLYFTYCKILTDDECELGEMEGCQIKLLWISGDNLVYKHSRDYEDSCMKIFLSIVGCINLLRSLRYLKFGCGEEMKKKLLSKAKDILGNDYDLLMPRFKC